MKRNAPTLLLLACAALAGLVALAAWHFLSASGGAGASFDSRAETFAKETPATTEGSTPLAALPQDAQAAPPRMEEESRSAPERKRATTQADLELAEALWIDGRVVFPPGTPVGESVEVLAKGRKFKTLPLQRARVAASGTFHVAFAPGTKTGTLELEAAHLYLADPVSVKVSAQRPEEIVLEPLLGGCLRGQLILPPDAQGLRTELAGKQVLSSGHSDDWQQRCQRTAKVDADLRFELHGLAPGLSHSVYFDSGVCQRLREEQGSTVAAGEDVARDYQLKLGARVRGRVKNFLPDTSVAVAFASTEGNAEAELDFAEFGGDAIRATVAPDGSFDARGILPGKVKATAKAPQRLPAELDLGLLADGDVRDGVELVLQSGAQIGGRVAWPDGTPAVDARVRLQSTAEESDESFSMPQILTARTNAAGEFLFSGLGPGTHALLAQAAPAQAEGAEPRRGKVAEWKASIEDVALDSLGVQLTLLGGPAIRGRVVDDAGAPLKSFRVRARRADAGALEFVASAAASAAGDGSFEVCGLLDGTYEVTVSASGCADPPSQTVAVPTGSGELAFVAVRHARISGFVVRADGSPAPRATITARCSGEETSDTADARGAFVLRSVPAGDVTVSAGLPVAAQSAASSAPLALQLAPGQTLEGLRLALRIGGRVTGEVRPSRPGEELGGRSVTGTEKDGAGAFAGTTDDAGHFVIEHVDPGEYDIALTASASEVQALSTHSPTESYGDWQLQEDLQQHVHASVEDLVTTHVVFGAPSSRRTPVSGCVRRAGKPQPGVRVRCEALGDAPEKEIHYALSDAEGRYELALDHPQKCRIQVQPYGSTGIRMSRTLEVPDGGSHDVDFVLSSGRIAGSLVRAQGVKARWADISLHYVSGASAPEDVEIDGGRSSPTKFDFEDLPPGTYALVVDTDFTLSVEDSDETPHGLRREIVLGQDEQVVGLTIDLPAAH